MNQIVLNRGNVLHIYNMLASNPHTNVSFVTLCSTAYEDLGCENGEGTEGVSFEREGGQVPFMTMSDG